MKWLFDYGNFTPRSACGSGWSDGLIFINQLSNLAIALPYFSISICLFIVWYNLRISSLLDSAILLYFSAFIGICGLSHINNIIAFHYPMYHFFTLIDVITGIVSTITACILPLAAIRIVKYFKTFPARIDELQVQMANIERALRRV